MVGVGVRGCGTAVQSSLKGGAEMTPDFDWHDSDSIVIRLQPGVAVYLNPHDEVVIRQEDQYDVSDDHFVYIARDNVLKVVERMLEVAGISTAEPLLLPAPTKAAERQRRYRQRHRNGNGRDETVTRDDGELPLRLIAAE